MIGGNKKAFIQIRATTGENEIGEAVIEWGNVAQLIGFLDLSAGDSKYTTYNAKIQESTHIFICDYKSIKALGEDWVWDEIDFINSFISTESGEVVQLISENSRMLIDGKTYDVMLIDDPMELHQHLEIFLKYTGGQ